MQGYFKSRSMKELNDFSNYHQRFILNWLNSYKIGKILTLTEVPEKFRTGVYPLQLLQASDPSLKNYKINTKLRSREDCFRNIDFFLAYLTKHGLNEDKSLANCLYLGKSQTV